MLRPGGRVAVSDIALKKPLPPEIAKDVMAYVGWIAGAIRIEDYEAGLREAGFSSVAVIDAKSDLNAYSKVEGQSGCCSPKEPAASASSCCSGSSTGHRAKAAVHEHLSELTRRHNVNDYAASVKVFARKP